MNKYIRGGGLLSPVRCDSEHLFGRPLFFVNNFFEWKSKPLIYLQQQISSKWTLNTNLLGLANRFQTMTGLLICPANPFFFLKTDMAKDPAFLFYPNDYLGGTMGMTFEEKGAYIELLMLQFNRGHMTSHMIGQTVGQIWPSIQNKFIQDPDGLYYNARLEEEQKKRKAFTDSRKQNKDGKNQYSNKGGHTTSHMIGHMEDVNRDINYTKKKESKFIPPTLDEVKQYFRDNNYSIDSAMRAFNYYMELDWHIATGRTIKNWKAQMQSTWFKPENKIQTENNPTLLIKKQIRP